MSEPTWLFTPPTVKEAMFTRGKGAGLFNRLRLDVGVTVLKQGGSYAQVRDPGPEEMLAADRVYLGGHNHLVDDAEAADLQAAGYGACLRPAN